MYARAAFFLTPVKPPAISLDGDIDVDRQRRHAKACDEQATALITGGDYRRAAWQQRGEEGIFSFMMD